MGKQKGQQKTGGREKGTPNKTTRDVREFLFTVIQNNMQQLETDLLKLEPKERWQTISGLFPYIVTKKENNRFYKWEFSPEKWENMCKDAD